MDLTMMPIFFEKVASTLPSKKVKEAFNAKANFSWEKTKNQKVMKIAGNRWNRGLCMIQIE